MKKTLIELEINKSIILPLGSTKQLFKLSSIADSLR